MTNDECRNPKEARSSKPELPVPQWELRHSGFELLSDFGFRIFNRVGQLHDVEEIAFTAPDVKQRQLAGMFTGETLEALNAFELALEGAVVFKRMPPHDLHRAQDARRTARQPHFAIRTAADAPEKLVIRDGRRLGVGSCILRGARSTESEFFADVGPEGEEPMLFDSPVGAAAISSRSFMARMFVSARLRLWSGRRWSNPGCSRRTEPSCSVGYIA